MHIAPSKCYSESDMFLVYAVAKRIDRSSYNVGNTYIDKIVKPAETAVARERSVTVT
jgi:hypothetical protein